MRGASWLNAVLGVWLVIAPSVLQLDGTAATNSMVVAIFVIIAGVASATVNPANHVWAWINLASGMWMFISPWMLGVALLPGAFWNAMIIGTAIVLLALLRMASDHRPPAGVTA